MKELLVISGKGGTGKTSITASLASLAGSKVLCDCDVDAADLHLLLKPEVIKEEKFYGLQKAFINQQVCSECGECVQACKYDAIKQFKVNDFACEGCRVCYYVCPEGAVELRDSLSGYWYISQTKYGSLVHAYMEPGEENSGKLVAEVRKAAKELAEEQGCSYLISDGPPGTGCPVISSLAGVDLALMVVEPSVTGVHDLERVIDLAEGFSVATAVCINKWNINEEISTKIEKFCRVKGIPLVGKIPFDETVSRAIAAGVPPVEFAGGAATAAIKGLWGQLEEMLAGIK